MLFTLLQSIALLTLAGIGIFAMQLQHKRLRDPRLRSVIIGCVLGVVTALITANALVVEGIRAPLDAKVGPLVFAGYLGGPLAGAIAGGLGALSRIWVGGPNILLGVTVFLLLGQVGALVARAFPPRKHRLVPPPALGFLVLGAFLVQLLPLAMAQGRLPGSDVNGSLTTFLAFQSFSVLSILVMAGILTLSNRFRLESLRADELGRKLELIAHSAKLGVFERQAGSDRILFDRGMMSIYGLDRPPGHVKVPEWTAMLHPADKGDMLDMLSRLWAGDPNVRQMEFRIRRGDGKTRNIRIHWVTQFNRKGEVARVLGIQEDVTDIRQAELQRQLVEARLERIIANLPGVIVSLDLSDPTQPRPIFVSPQCKDIWGFTPEEFLASEHPLDLLHPPAERADMLAQLTAAAESLTPFTHRFRVSTEDGRERWFETHTCASRLADGSVQTDGIILDVTPEMRAQEQLEAQRLVAMRAQKHESIGQLTGGVAHDFNNLLAVIMGNLELLRDGIDAPDLLRMVDTSIGATRRGADLTRNMLAFARKAPLEPEVFDLNRLVEETRNWAGRTLPASIHVETILLADLWQVKADPSSTESALLNLILNARDAMQDGGQLTIETANIHLGPEDALPLAENLEPGKYVMLAVRDTGQGIPENSLAQIFEPFYSTKPPGAGTGLGLSMVEGFTRQSGGAVSVSSEPGLGTTFELFFKAHTGAVDTATPVQAVAGAKPATGQRLLVVEDEPEVLSVLVTTLERAGFTVASAPSGDEALVLFETCPEFDLLLTDIVMPGRLQGTDLAQELRSRAPDLPVVFLSGYAKETMGRVPGFRPEDIRLTKPVRRAELLEAIRKSLSARNAGRTGGSTRDADAR